MNLPPKDHPGNKFAFIFPAFLSKNINITFYFLCTWLFSVFLCAYFIRDSSGTTLRDQVHIVLILLTYGAIYQAPAALSYWLLRHWRIAAISSAILFSVMGHLFVFADSHLYDLYGFHINEFVWNLLMSDGGIASLGADQSSSMVIIGYVSVLLAVHVLALYLSSRLHNFAIPAGKILMLILVATLAERGIYGYSRAELYGPVLDRGDAFPLYQPLKINTFLGRLGVKTRKYTKIKLKNIEGPLDYPKHPIALKKSDKPLNIVILVSESLRWDLLNPEIMPNMTAFAQKAWNFKHHFSGGNGTRQGLFALFYGIYGNYWDDFLRRKRCPVLFDVLNDYGYQDFIYTSASFTYPEFDQTIFSRIPKEKLIEYHKGEPWKRDVINTSALINDIKSRDHSKPFFGFLFYEATHARYSFPTDQVIRKDYLRTLDYVGLSRKELAVQIDGMKARYENAAYGVDMQLQRVVNYLEKSGDLDTTLLIITGDHGEEFMERGHWGHNSAFTDWQIHVPMIIYMPNSSPRTITQNTSHMDIVPTILNRLGVKNPIRDYSLGINLSAPRDHRNIIVASWSDLGIVNDYGKLVIPFKSTTQHQNLATNLNDQPVDGEGLISKMKSTVIKVIANARYYKSRKQPHMANSGKGSNPLLSRLNKNN